LGDFLDSIVQSLRYVL